MEDRVIFCLVPGKRAFEVTISGDSSISKLEQLIQRTACPDVALMDLTLWKLNEPLIIEPTETLGKRVSDLDSQLSQHAVSLSAPNHQVLRWFPEQPSMNHVCIIVEVPPATISPSSCGDFLSGSRKPSISLEDLKHQKQASLTYSWLSELHSKIWDRKDLRKDLFHEVTVTMSHYRELETKLEELRTRGATDDEFHSVKLGVLRDYNPPLVDTAGKPVEDREHEEDLDTLFPATFEYLDLSKLNLNERTQRKLEERLPLPLLIRKEFSILTKLVDNPTANNNRYVHLGGQPDIGKTAYIHFLMIKYMLEGRPFLYQSLSGEAYSISKDLKFMDGDWAPDSDDPIVALVDADFNDFTLNPCLQHRQTFIITASSPNPEVMKHANQYHRSKTPRRFMADLWSRDELFLTGIFLYPGDRTFKLLKKSTLYFGFNPSACFLASASEEVLDDCREEIKATIIKASRVPNIGNIFNETLTETGVSHSIFQLRPQDERRRLVDAQIEPVSMWAVTLYLDEYEKREKGAVRDFCRVLLAGKPYAQTFCDRISGAGLW